MRAIVVSELGGPEVMVAAEREDLAAGPGEILVRVAAAGVNFIDIYQRSGIGAYTQRTPYTPGGEGAGTVLGRHHPDRRLARDARRAARAAARNRAAARPERIPARSGGR